MNWRWIKSCPWIDTRARFVASVPAEGNLLDIGSSDGETINHFAELRPDIQFHATDLEGRPDTYPKGCRFFRGDIQRDPLPWEDGSIHAVTCMHLIEHLEDLNFLLSEVRRLLQPGGRVYFETPHPKTLQLSSPHGRAAGTFTLNFYDDLTHTRPVSMGGLAKRLVQSGMEVVDSGTSRNWLFASMYPLFHFLPASRQKFTSKVHWIGWSAYLIGCRPR